MEEMTPSLALMTPSVLILFSIVSSQLTWRTFALAWSGTWIYRKEFTFSPPATRTDHLLVFDGIKMGATISLNNHTLGSVLDQFVRAQFDVGELLQPGLNTIEVAFDPTLTVNGRFMACSGG
jgi:beta-galactosidase/beta-glucuronidase